MSISCVTISGLPWYELIVPVAQTRFPSQVLGFGENLPKGSPQIRIVNGWCG
jgi:hypothetical protein